MLTKEIYTTYEMTIEMYKAMGKTTEGVDFDSHETVDATDNFAMDNDYYFFPKEFLYKKPNDSELASKIGKGI